MKKLIASLLLLLVSIAHVGCGTNSEDRMIKTGGQVVSQSVNYNYLCFVEESSAGAVYSRNAPVLLYKRDSVFGMEVQVNLARSESGYFAVWGENRHGLESGSVYVVEASSNALVSLGRLPVGHDVSSKTGLEVALSTLIAHRDK